MLPDYYSYTAVFSRDKDGWYVVFPDLERCATNADTLDEAIIQAGYILEDYMAILERDNMPIPAPTPHKQIHTPNNGEKQRIVVPMHNARIRWRRRNVKRTVSLPAWIVQRADSEGLNLSTFLQDALTEHINNRLEYKNFCAEVEVDFKSHMLHGRIDGIRDLVNFESETVDGIIKEFHCAVDDYIAFCEEVGKSPDTPQSIMEYA